METIGKLQENRALLGEITASRKTWQTAFSHKTDPIRPVINFRIYGNKAGIVHWITAGITQRLYGLVHRDVKKLISYSLNNLFFCLKYSMLV